ncbi:MAG TPA: TatD family hydrolase [Elusimicrobiales bacterium]|nr:TatD family hydrolase [Elusimicrobiales bacterium]
MKPTYCDSHAHLLDNAFDADREQIIEQSFADGIENIAEIACEPKDWNGAVALQKKYPKNIKCALGIHPHNCDKLTPDTLKKLKTFFADDNISALGEIGLDYAKSTFDKETQKETLITILKETASFNKPLILHCRNDFEGKENAYADLADILKSYWTPPTNRKITGILHCFSSAITDAVWAVDMGLLIGIGGIITYPKNDALRETAVKVRLENLITETDCPYLPPQTQRGKRNSPLNIPEICKALGEILKVPAEKISKVTVKNFKEVFK